MYACFEYRNVKLYINSEPGCLILNKTERKESVKYLVKDNQKYKENTSKNIYPRFKNYNDCRKVRKYVLLA